MTIKTFKTTERFSYLWLKYVNGFNLSVHCAKCLEGKYSRLFPFRKKVLELSEAALDEYQAKYMYLCGVTNEYSRNLHIAFEYAEGETLHYIDGKTIVVIENARQIEIIELSSYQAEPKGKFAIYNTCRNWRFAYQMTHSKDESEL